MPSGHASHQVGLDADIWLTEMPDHELSAIDREKMEQLCCECYEVVRKETDRLSMRH